MKLRHSFLAVSILAGVSPVLAQTAPGSFGLGQIETVTVAGIVPATPDATVQMSASTLPSENIYAFHTTQLNQTLDLIPGVAASNSGGSRNEQLIFVHGFDRFQTPLSIDGIRVYLPADNRLDFARFLSADLSEIQVAKGYVSVLNGPGALGGAINLVTRKPVSEFDVEARSGLVLGNSGSLDTTDASLSVGTKEGNFYLEGGAAWSYTARTELSDQYHPTATQPAGFRLHSRSRDLTLHAKAGYTPNETDEYSINFIKTVSAKDAPFSVSDTIASQRDWNWPYFDISSVYFLSNTALGDNAYVKTKLYYNNFSNGLFSYDNANYTTQSLARAFRSFYSDYAFGGSIEGDINLADNDTLKGSFFYRRDSHKEVQQIYSPAFIEPPQLDLEDTYSVAAENTWHATQQLDVVAGVSYDWRELSVAQDFVDPATAADKGTFINYPLKNGGALNGQAALIYNVDENSSYYANVSDRTRFPTIFERFSTRFGTAASNPGLKAERAANFEIGTKQNFDGLRFDGSLFYSNVTNVIQGVILPPPAPANTTQSRNVGHGIFYGAEAALSGALLDDLSGGINLTYQVRHIITPVGVAPLQLTGDPMYKGFAYLDWAVTDDLVVTPNITMASNRWSSNTAGTVYFKTGGNVLPGLSVDYHFLDYFDINAGVKNLLDANYQLASGFPDQGRTFFMELRFRQ